MSISLGEPIYVVSHEYWTRLLLSYTWIRQDYFAHTPWGLEDYDVEVSSLNTIIVNDVTYIFEKTTIPSTHTDTYDNDEK